MTGIELDAKTPMILLQSDTTGGDYSEETVESCKITLNCKDGVIEARNDNGVAQLSAAGVFCNNSGTNALPNSTGWIHKASIVGLGFGNLNKSNWAVNENESVIAGVYGRASNSGTAPAFGGFFYDLYAGGLILGKKCITGTSNNTWYLNSEHTVVIGYTSAASVVYLPASPKEGQTIFVKQWWRGYMRFRPRAGQLIYDDTSTNDYYDFGEGQGGMFTFTIGYVDNVKKEAWLVSRWKY